MAVMLIHFRKSVDNTEDIMKPRLYDLSISFQETYKNNIIKMGARLKVLQNSCYPPQIAWSVNKQRNSLGYISLSMWLYT